MNKHKRICVIFTGGTIGSSARHGTVGLDGGSRALLLDGYRQKYGTDIAFDELCPVEMLSENVRAGDLERLAACLRRVPCGEYDGVIVTHGTDTLNFTANYFAMIFADAPVPVVFVSSLYPLADPRANGPDNFAGAVAFIEQAAYGGVFVAFKNAGEPCAVHLASRVGAPDAYDGAPGSVGGLRFGHIRNGVFRRNDDPRNPTETALQTEAHVPLAGGLCNEVVAIRARALLDFSFYDFSAHKPRAVIVELYHSGTICTQGGDASFLRFRDRCLSQGIAVAIAPVASAANVYDSAAGLTTGCAVAYDTSFDVALVKVMCALHAHADLQETLDRNVFYEKICK